MTPSTISPNLNPTTTTSPYDITLDNPTVYNLELIKQRENLAPFEWLKNWSNTIFRNDTQNALGANMVRGLTEQFTVDRELINAGVTNGSQLLGYEEQDILSTFTYQAGLVRHAVATSEFYQNLNIGLTLAEKKHREKLNAWAVKRKQYNDIGRLITGADGLHKLYGGGKVSAASSITSANVLQAKSLGIMREVLEAYGGHPVAMLDAKTMQREQHSSFIYLIDTLVGNRLILDPNWQAQNVSPYNNSAGFHNPIAQIALGQFANMIVIPVEGAIGFGSALRPECMVATTGSAITNTSSAAVQVGLPQLSSGTYTSYDSSTSLTNFTEFFKNMITGSGVVNCPVVIKRSGSPDLTGLTAVWTSTYSLTITNNSGSSWTPTAGDRIISQLTAGIGLGANAMISGYSSDVNFTNDMRDYGLNKGVGVEFWEGGAVVKDTQGQVPGVGVDFFYSPVLQAS